MVDIEELKRLCKANQLRWTNHIFRRLVQRGIAVKDIICVLLDGEIVEQYPTDYPYPSCLVLGTTANNEAMHVVCSIGEEELWLITAYYPNAEEWTHDFRTRKEAGR